MEWNVNTAWCRAIAEEVVRLGVVETVVCPGTRSAAMVAALREHATMRLYVQTDERSAGYFAFGMARGGDRPVAICVTSGSAVANLVPVLTEAYAVGAPLLVLSCDRPRRFRNAGMPQTTKQVEFCASLVFQCVDLDDPTTDSQRLRNVRLEIANLAEHMRPGPARGPVQINIPLLGRLSSVDGAHGWDVASDQRSPTIQDAVRAQPIELNDPPADIAALASTLGLRPGLKGLIVIGPNCTTPPSSLATFVELSRFPLLADAPGRLRGSGISGTVAEADMLVTRGEFLRLKPDLVIRFGTAPVSHTVHQYLSATRAKVLHISDRRIDADFLAKSFVQLVAPDESTLLQLAQCVASGDEHWRNTWIATAKACRDRIAIATEALGWGEVQAIATALACPYYRFVHVANSMPIRLANLLLPASNDGRVIYANRGVSGIDGTFGTFLGELAACGASGLLLTGDLAAIHDIPALEACLHGDYRGAIVIINNCGAGLFDVMPVRGLPDYERLLRNPAPVDFSSIARAFGITHRLCRNRESLTHALTEAAHENRLHMIEAAVPVGGISQELSRLTTLVLER